MFKKAAVSAPQPGCAKTSLTSGKAAGLLARRAYRGVHEHDKRPRTPLADPAPSRGHAFSPFPYTMRASVSPYTGPEPARRSVLAHSFRVVPVVKTSSTNKIRLPLMRARLATEKALPGWSGGLSLIGRFVEELVEFGGDRPRIGGSPALD